MKKDIGLLIIGAVLGFGLASLVSSKDGGSASVGEEGIKPKTDPESLHVPSSSRGQGASLSDAAPQEYQANLDEVRLGVLLDLVEDGAYISGLDLDDQFEWGEQFFRYGNLDEKQVELVKSATKELLIDLKKYEFDNKQVVEEDEFKLIYRLGADVDYLNRMKDDFLAGLGDIGGKDLAQLAKKTVSKKFKDLSQERLVSLRLYDENQTAERYERLREESDLGEKISYGTHKSFRLKVTYVDKAGNSRGGSSGGGILNEGETPRRLTRYDHLFAID